MNKLLKKEFVWYARRLWPFAVGLAVATAIAGIIVIFDRNSVEATGFVAGIGIFILAAVALVVGEIVLAFLSFHRDFSKQDDTFSPEESRKVLFWAKFIAYAICMAVTAIFVFAGTLPFTWKMLLNFNAEWQYFLEAVVFIVILVPLLYLVPATLSLEARIHAKHNALRVSTTILGVLFLILLFPLIVFEIQLLIHSESTNMQGIWITVTVMLALCAIADVCACILIRDFLKKRGEPTI